jgi:hypothetical protein
MTEDIKAVADMGATGTAFGSVVGILPDVAAVLSIIWVLIRIFEWARVRLFKYPPSQNEVQ